MNKTRRKLDDQTRQPTDLVTSSVGSLSAGTAKSNRGIAHQYSLPYTCF